MNFRGIPDDWQNTTLEVCVDILDSQRAPVNNRERQGRIQDKAPDQLYPYFGATGEVGKIDDYLFDEELVALGEDGVPFLDPGKPKAYMLSGKTWVNNHAHVLRASHGVTTNRFLLHYLNQFDYQDFVNGGTRLKLTQANMRRMPFSLPPLAEQKVIADKLDTLLAQVENTKARLERIPQILKRFRQSVLAAAVSGRLTEDWRGGLEYKDIEVGDEVMPVPVNWQTTSVGGIIDGSRKLCYGVVQPGDEVVGGTPLIRVCDIQRGEVDCKNLRTISPQIDERYGRSKVKSGDILVTIVGAIGRIAVIRNDIDANIARAVARVSPNQLLVHPIFVHCWLSSPTMQWWLVNSSKEVARKTLNLKELKTAPIPLPMLQEQTEIVRRVDQLFAHADRTEQQVNNALARVNNLTQSILAKAFRGELTEQWRKDNPELISGENRAAALLERIKAERAVPKPAKKAQKKVSS